MTTNYPTSIDTFVNPTSNDSLNSPSHSQQHTNLNDAMVAVQTKLGYGNANHVGIDLINTTTFTSTTTINFNNVFTATYNGYLIIFSNFLAASATDVNIQMRSGSTNTGGTAYSYSRIYGNYSSGVTGAGATGAAAWVSGIVGHGGARTAGTIEIINPFLPERTIYTARSADTRASGAIGLTTAGGYLADNNSYDGFSVGAGVNLEGTISVYGYRNS